MPQGGGRKRAVIAAVLRSFGMLYVVALGPAIVLANHGPFWEDILRRMYAPLGCTYARSSATAGFVRGFLA
jgi:hypothetical protein